jgi:hypothetical protein
VTTPTIEGARGAPPRLRVVVQRWAGSEGRPAPEEDEEATDDSDSEVAVRPRGHVAAARCSHGDGP